MFPETILQMNNGATVMELSNALEMVVAAVRAAGKSRFDHSHYQGGARQQGVHQRADGRVAGEKQTARNPIAA